MLPNSKAVLRPVYSTAKLLLCCPGNESLTPGESLWVTQVHSAPPLCLFFDLKDIGERKLSVHPRSSYPYVCKSSSCASFLKTQMTQTRRPPAPRGGLWVGCQCFLTVTFNLPLLHTFIPFWVFLWWGFVFLALSLTQGLIL